MIDGRMPGRHPALARRRLGVHGMVEDTIQRAQGQVRTTRLDLEAAAGVRLNPTVPIWNWLVEFAAQRISGDDRLTAIQRIRGISITSPKTRFGEKVLHKVAKTVRLGKAEARWREGL